MRLTAGLKCAPLIGPNISIKILSTKATAIASAITAIPISEFNIFEKSIMGVIAARVKNNDPR